jgi:putative sterol carrier protein
MGIKFGSEEWMAALKEELNKSDAYRDAAKTWEGDFYWVVTGMPGEAADVYLYVDLWHGECRSAARMADAAAKKPEFVIEATFPVWRKVVDKKLDPIQGMVTRQLKLKGNMLKIMKAPKAATELVLCATRVATDWPA